MVKAIQVGLGGWGFNWSQEVIPNVPNVEMVGYVDTNPDAIKRVTETLGVAPELCFASLADAAAATKADLVIATLRTDAHYPVVKQALELGMNVIVEKPFASTIEQARELVEIAERNNLILMVSQNYRHQQAPLAVSEMIADEKFGPVNFVSIDFRRHAPTQGYRYWDMPDPLLADMSIHHFDLMRMVLKKNPVRISCRTWNPAGSPFSYDPAGVALIEFEGGTMVSYRGSWVSTGTPTAWSGEWSIDCAKGELAWTSRDDFQGTTKPDHLVLRPLEGAEDVVKLKPIAFTDRLGTLNAMANAVATGTLPPHFSSGRDNLWSLGLTVSAIKSASQDGAWVHVADVVDLAE
ncbi:Gfo/Idh/MocA family protein [Devosia sp.]|uniref:Gfo/Idh/MocA family protein n=1 Tax=Devosia sp. TaxID=1871048 RepID=UPI003A922B69